MHQNTDRSDKRHRNRKVYRVDYFKTYRYERFQITLDGPKEQHDKVKFQNNCPSAFTHVLNNIEYILFIWERSQTKRVFLLKVFCCFFVFLQESCAIVQESILLLL